MILKILENCFPKLSKLQRTSEEPARLLGRWSGLSSALWTPVICKVNCLFVSVYYSISRLEESLVKLVCVLFLFCLHCIDEINCIISYSNGYRMHLKHCKIKYVYEYANVVSVYHHNLLEITNKLKKGTKFKCDVGVLR